MFNVSINGRLSLVENPVPVRDYIRAALDLEEVHWKEEHGSKDEVGTALVSLVLMMSKPSMIERFLFYV